MPTEAIYVPAHKTVRFAIYPEGFEGPRILAEISEDALKNYFGASDSALEIVQSYRYNFAKIQAIALKKYALSPSSFILIKEEDFNKSS